MLQYKEAEDEEPSSPKADKVKAEAEEAAETSVKAPKEEEPNTAKPVSDEDDLNAKVETEQRRSKQRRPLTLTDKPKMKKKTKMTKKDTIDLSNEEPQEANYLCQEKTIFAKDTLQAPETDNIDNFKKSMTYGEQVMVPILRPL
ncbi:hypothetical protein R1flu_004967 [Riccia fluitans]|uniref:Uncharacterized protein n=1 Tax=Riccia fluitans TaxID=41844 RepID=A0ABD1YSE8_9MARC